MNKEISAALAIKAAKMLLPPILAALGGFALAAYPAFFNAFCQIG